MNPFLLVWTITMILIAVTPLSLLAGIDLWRIVLVELFLIVYLMILGWLEQ